MSEILQDTFYRERFIQQASSSTISLWTKTEMTQITEKAEEQKKIKQLSKKPLENSYNTQFSQFKFSGIIIQGLSHFGVIAEGDNFAYLSLNLSDNDIYGLIGVDKFKHLQYVDVSWNNLITLNPLSTLKYLTYLNASHNKLSKLLDFVPPLNLETVDCSYNQINLIPNLKQHRFLKTLILNNNKILEINGISENKALSDLRLNNNSIEVIENLDNLNLVELHLQGNKIKETAGLSLLKYLRILNLSRNTISRIQGLSDLMSLRNLYLTENKIRKIKQMFHLQQLPYLSVLDLCYNPIQEKRYYRLQLLFRLPSLRILDGVNVIPKEIAQSENLYGLNIQESKQIFDNYLPEEEFIDRRIYTDKMIEPETDSEEENIDFVDKYDSQGKIIDENRSTHTKHNQTHSQTQSSQFNQTNTDNNFYSKDSQTKKILISNQNAQK